MRILLLSFLATLCSFGSAFAESKTVTVTFDDFEESGQGKEQIQTLKPTSEAAKAGFAISGFFTLNKPTYSGGVNTIKMYPAKKNWLALTGNSKNYVITKVEAKFYEFYATTPDGFYPYKESVSLASSTTPPQSPDYVTYTYKSEYLDIDGLQKIDGSSTQTFTTSDGLSTKFFLIGGNPYNVTGAYYSYTIKELTITYESSSDLSYDNIILESTSTTLNADNDAVQALSLNFNYDGDLHLYTYHDKSITVKNSRGEILDIESTLDLYGKSLIISFTPAIDCNGNYILQLPRGYLGNATDLNAATDLNDYMEVKFSLSTGKERPHDYNAISVGTMYWNNSKLTNGTEGTSNLQTLSSVKVMFHHTDNLPLYFVHNDFTVPNHGIKVLSEEDEELQFTASCEFDEATGALTVDFDPHLTQNGSYTLVIPKDIVADYNDSKSADALNAEFRIPFTITDGGAKFAGLSLTYDGSPVLEHTMAVFGDNTFLMFEKPEGAGTSVLGGKAIATTTTIDNATAYPVLDESGAQVGLMLPKGNVQQTNNLYHGIEVIFAREDADSKRHQMLLNTAGVYSVELPDGFFKTYVGGSANPSKPVTVHFTVEGGELNLPERIRMNHVFNNGYSNFMHQYTNYGLENVEIPEDISGDVRFTIEPKFEVDEWDGTFHGATPQSHHYWHFINWVGEPSVYWNQDRLSFKANLAGVYNVKAELDPNKNYTSPGPVEFEIELTPTFDELYMACLVFEDGDNTQAKLAIEMPNMHRQICVVKHGGPLWYRVTRSSQSTPAPFRFAPAVVAEDSETELPDHTDEGYLLQGGSGIDMRDATRLDLILHSNGLTATHTVNINGTVTGVDGILADDAEVRYYDLTGCEIPNPAPGQVVIRLTGDKAERIIFGR